MIRIIQSWHCNSFSRKRKFMLPSERHRIWKTSVLLEIENQPQLWEGWHTRSVLKWDAEWVMIVGVGLWWGLYNLRWKKETKLLRMHQAFFFFSFFFLFFCLPAAFEQFFADSVLNNGSCVNSVSCELNARLGLMRPYSSRDVSSASWQNSHGIAYLRCWVMWW